MSIILIYTTCTNRVNRIPTRYTRRNMVNEMNELRKNINDAISEDEDGFNEMVYARVKAGDVLVRCLEDGSGAPMQQLVEVTSIGRPRKSGCIARNIG